MNIAEKYGKKIGIHAHNDGDLAIANSIAAIEAGAIQIQGTMNGYGERCGNANLCSVIPNLQLKLNNIKRAMMFRCIIAQFLCINF